MSALDSSSAAAQSAMEDSSDHRQGLPEKTRRHHPSPTTTTTVSTTTTGESDGEVEDAEEADAEAWATFNKSFQQVQSMLDRNRLLIQQVNENHQSRAPNNMAKNVSLIQELNGNISKVVSLYSDLNSNFSSMCQQHANHSNGRLEK
ncbi:protein EARLY FLOWERING 4 [Senna tora]|uniref:Protein EARLY FLOWERING 4 n=1 Tax=Senna tora TaxID=362788 RepID=A0A834U274_9FABA|nr:protein EARLY FLOWERING 4 [Senna tora]